MKNLPSIVLAILLLAVPTLHAGETAKPKLTVAVLDFAAKDPGNPDLGKQVAETVAVSLSMEDTLTVVDRSDLERTAGEHELNLSGVVDTNTAVRLGKMVGARILVTGKVFPLGNKIILTAKLIGTETTLVEGVLVKGEASGAIDELVLSLAEKIAEKLYAEGPTLVGKPDPEDDTFARLQRTLRSRKLPTVAIVVREEHHGETANQRLDPAAETEIKRMLLACKVPVRDVEANTLTDWMGGIGKGRIGTWPQSLAGVDLVIAGEAFSEYSTRVGNLVSCAGRVEVNVIDRTSGKVVLADRRTARSADLSEGMAGKAALEKAAHEVGLLVLEQMVETSSATEDDE
jgi:TolB-like protein